MPITIRGIPDRHVGNFTVANLPTAVTLKTLAAGDLAFATNGRSGAQTAGNGTGVLCYWTGASWNRVDDGTAVAA